MFRLSSVCILVCVSGTVLADDVDNIVTDRPDIVESSNLVSVFRSGETPPDPSDAVAQQGAQSAHRLG